MSGISIKLLFGGYPRAISYRLSVSLSSWRNGTFRGCYGPCYFTRCATLLPLPLCYRTLQIQSTRTCWPRLSYDRYPLAHPFHTSAAKAAEAPVAVCHRFIVFCTPLPPLFLSLSPFPSHSSKVAKELRPNPTVPCRRRTGNCSTCSRRPTTPTASS